MVVLSGKGGTGKTVILASFASLAKNAVIADCDVDAPNLHLLLRPETTEGGAFSSSKVAVMNGQRCNGCQKCLEACRFEAITTVGNTSLKKVAIDRDACEGCGVCMRICPSDAIKLEERESGEWFVSKTRFGLMTHALLAPGGENSGKLVALVKQKAKMIAHESRAALVLVDGPPGLSCPVISAAAGADLLVLVAEPTVSGLSDFTRIADLCNHMKADTVLIVNRWDINPDISNSIEKEAAQRGVACLGRIPYDDTIPEAVANALTPIESSKGPSSALIEDIWRRIEARVR